MKLIINSHVSFDSALNKLIESMNNCNFKMWDKVIVVRGGCPSPSMPYQPKGMNGMSFVDMSENFYDYNGHCMLGRMADHPEISEESYMYILDTCTTNSTFTEKFAAMENLLNNNKNILHASPPCYASNICAFRKEFIKTWGDEFEFKGKAKNDKNGVLSINKSIALEYECHLIKKPGTFYLKDREICGNDDIYKKGFIRRGYIYPDFGIIKWILICRDSSGMDGDFYKTATKIKTPVAKRKKLLNEIKEAHKPIAGKETAKPSSRYNNITRRK